MTAATTDVPVTNAAPKGQGGALSLPVIAVLLGWLVLALRDGLAAIAADAPLQSALGQLLAALPGSFVATGPAALAAGVEGLARGTMLFSMALGLTAALALRGRWRLGHPGHALLGAAVGGLVLSFGTGGAIAGPPVPAPALLAAAAAAALLAGLATGAMADLLIHAPLAAAPRRALFAGLGLLVILGELATALGGGTLWTGLPGALPQSLGGAVSVPLAQALALGLGVLVLAALAIGAGRQVGLVLRAATAEPEMVAALGYRPRRRTGTALIACAGLAGLAGFVFVQVDGVASTPSWPGLAALILLTAALAGPGSVRGLLSAALILGLSQGFAQAAAADPLLVALAVAGGLLLLRPGGLVQPLRQVAL